MENFIGSGRVGFPVTVEFSLNVDGQKDAITSGKNSSKKQKTMTEFPAELINDVTIDSCGNCEYVCKIVNEYGEDNFCEFNKYPIAPNDFVSLIKRNNQQKELIQGYFERILSTPCEDFEYRDDRFFFDCFSIGMSYGCFVRKDENILMHPSDSTKHLVLEKLCLIKQSFLNRLDLSNVVFELKKTESTSYNLDIRTNVNGLTVRDTGKGLYYYFNGDFSMTEEHKEFFKPFIEQHLQNIAENQKAVDAGIAERELKVEKKERALQLLKEWSIEHGSKRLQLIIKNEMKFENIAKEEWVEAHFPDFVMLKNNETWSTYEKLNPDFIELQEFEKWKELTKDMDFVKSIELNYSRNQTRSYSVTTIDIELYLFDGLEFSVWKELLDREESEI